MSPRGWLALAAVVAACAACAERANAPPYLHNRQDYEDFRARHPGLIEPNYLPFMLWKADVPGSEDAWLILCRFDREAFPMPVFIEEPEIGEAVQDEFQPVEPEVFVRAALRAFAVWEAELEGLVSFRRVSDPAEARLTLRLIAEPAPVHGPGVKVLGTTPLGDACRVQSAGDLGERLRVAYDVPELWVYVADEFGLLNDDQVERIALHEIGHVLGMRAHSPVPNDLMFETVREVPGLARLSAEDVNSFVSLYRLPNGTVYRRLPPEGAAAPPRVRSPSARPRLALAPHVDTRRGFEIQLPEGWMKVETPTGLVAIDGLTWDYSASLQVIVRRFETLGEYLDRYASAHVGGGTVLAQGALEVGGRRAFRMVVQSPDELLEDHTTFVESGDGRVFVVIADCASPVCEAYQPWFEATLRSLEILASRPVGRSQEQDREYGPEPP